MAQTIDLKLKIGPTVDKVKPLPTVTDSTTPVISWITPDNITQRRYNIRIDAIEPGLVGSFVLGETFGSDTTYQYPIGKPMNYNFYGLLKIEVAISEESDYGREFEYTSGPKYYVLDPNTETILNTESTYFQWTDSQDSDATTQNLIYQLIVSKEPTFSEPTLKVVDVNVNEDVSSSFTKHLSSLESGFAYFWKVRAYDGLDWGAWTLTNGFYKLINYPPEIIINSVTPIGNIYGDVIINFTLIDLDEEPVYIEMNYTGGSVSQEKTKISLVNFLGHVQPGNHSITWRSGRDEKLISADDYVIYAIATDSVSSGREAFYGPFSMNNAFIGTDTGGIGPVDVEFQVNGTFVNLISSDYKKVAFPNLGHLSSDKENSTEYIRVIPSKIKPWMHYELGLISSNLRTDNGPQGGLPNPQKWNSNYGTDMYPAFGQEYEPPKPALVFNGNMAATPNITEDIYFEGQNTNNGLDGINVQTDDFEQFEPDFTEYKDFVGSDGYHVKIDEKKWGKSRLRFGYAHVIKINRYDREPCIDCQGKGWQVGELIPVLEPSGFFKRQPCSSCNGSRFNKDIPIWSTSEEPKMLAYIEHQWIPIGELIQPIDYNHISGFSIEIPDLTIKKHFKFGPPITDENTSEITYQIEAPTIITSPTKHNNYISSGVIPWLNIYGGNLVNKEYSNIKPKIMPVEGEVSYIAESYSVEEPINGNIRAGKESIITGYGPEESKINVNRNTPTHKWEKGIWSMSGNIFQIEPLEPLKIIYLQSGWDAYNTIHWQATISSVSRIHLQVAKFFEDGTRTEYVDVITEGAEYFPEINSYLVAPNLWSSYWDIIRKQLLEDGYDYRLRIRQFDTVSKASSQWVYSNKFVIDRFATNPVSIIKTEYDKWRKILNIKFRIDDSQNDYYDLTRFWYSVDGSNFIEIENGNIIGDKYNLNSTRKYQNGLWENEHNIGWKVASYNLEPGSKYRFRIEVIPSKVANGASPPFFRWTKDYNPKLRIAELNLLEMQGQVQYYVYNGETDEFEYIPDGVAIPGRIDKLEYEKEQFELTPGPSGKWIYYTPQNNTGVLTDQAGYQEWLDEEIVPGITRNQILQEKEDEIEQIRRVEIPKWNLARDNAEKNIRKGLINQGFFSNGFVDNNPSNGIFRFRVESAPGASSVNLTTGEYIPYYESRFEVYNRIQLDFFTSFDSQPGGLPLRDILFDVDGERISGGRRDREIRTQPDGQTKTQYNTWESEETFQNFGNNEGKPWDTGLREDAEGGFLGNNYEKSKTKDDIPYVAYTIPKTELPGERKNFFLNNSFPSITDTLPDGKDDFNKQTYNWRVASYNIVNGVPEEKPMPIITKTQLAQPLKKIIIDYDLYADEELQSATIVTGYYSISPTGAYYTNDAEISIPTDRPVGYEGQDDDNPTIHVPYGLNRSRPSVLLTEDHQFYMWYSKPNAYMENTIVGARGKNANTFGEYELLFPKEANRTLYSYNQSNSITTPCVVDAGGLYKLYATMFKSGSNKIITSESVDAEDWSNPIEVSGIPLGSYSPFVMKDGNNWKMWFCQNIITSEIYYATSQDGITWMVENSNAPVLTHSSNINAPWVVKNETGYIIYYTRYDSFGNSTIWSSVSIDGIVWYGEKEEIATVNSLNPCVIVVPWRGNLTYRIFYNTMNGSDIRIRTAIKTDRVWSSFVPFTGWPDNHYNIIGDRDAVTSSKFGNSHRFEIVLDSNYIPEELTDSSPEDDIIIGFDMENDDTTREYFVQSSWVDYENKEELNAIMSPDIFFYNEEIKNMNFGDGF